MIKKCLHTLIALLVLSPALASQTRVESTGGLSLVLQDSSAEVNPYNFGNPAGLALLPAVSRFDISAPWFQLYPASSSFQSMQADGFLSRLTSGFDNTSLLSSSTNAFQYEGLILFPTPKWAFQAGGDLLHATNQPDTTAGIMDQSLDSTRALGRTAYDFGPFAFGAQFQWAQYNFNYQPVSGAAATLISGNTTETLLIPEAGLLASFPMDSSKSPAILRLGGSFTMILPSSTDNQNFDGVVIGAPVTVEKNITVSSYQSFGPEAYLDVPDSLQAVILDHLENTSLSQEQTSSSAATAISQPAFHLETENGNVFLGLFKWHFPLLISSKGILNMDQGAYLLINSKQVDYFDPAGTTAFATNNSDIQGAIGTGLDKDKDFGVGLQATLETQSGSSDPAGGTSLPVNFFGYQVSLGGEKWFSKVFAFRTGIVFESDRNQGAQAVQRPFYFVPSGTQITCTTLTVGAGYADSGLQTDLRLWYGQPSIYDSPNPNDFATTMGAQLSLSILFR